MFDDVAGTVHEGFEMRLMTRLALCISPWETAGAAAGAAGVE